MNPLITLPLPLAGIEDWYRLIVIVVFVLVWIINSVLSGKTAGKPRTPQRGQGPQRGQEPQRGPGPQRGQGQLVRGPGGEQTVSRPLDEEIDSFMKRASQKRQEKQRRKSGSKPAVVPRPLMVEEAPRRLQQSEADRASFEVRTLSSTVAEHTAKHLDTREFAERASKLVDEDILRDDAEREAHLRQVFGHQIGRLADTSLTSAAAAAQTSGRAGSEATTVPTPNSIAALLANPENLKQAIVLNEILTRPEHRW